MTTFGRQDSRKPGIFRDIGRDLLEVLADCLQEYSLQEIKNDIELACPGTQVSIIPYPTGATLFHINFRYYDGDFYPISYLFQESQYQDNRTLSAWIRFELHRGKYAFGPSPAEVKATFKLERKRARSIAKLVRKYGISSAHAADVLDGVSVL